MGKTKSTKKVSVKWARQRRKKQLELEKEVNNNEKEENVSPLERELEENLSDSGGKLGPSGQEPVRKRSKRQAGKIIWDADHFLLVINFNHQLSCPPTKVCLEGLGF